MVETQISARGVKDNRLLDAMRKIPRHLFVEEGLYAQAYNDYPLPIGEKQTISQPYMAALMTGALELTGKEKVLEIGTGSGYQTAILSMLAYKVYSMERISTLAARARKLLDTLMCPNVIIRVSDGTLGWPDEAPFDAILVAAASPQVPENYLQQLADKGRLVMPVGTEESQKLIKVVKSGNRLFTSDLGACRFVKLVGKHGWHEEKAPNGSL